MKKKRQRVVLVVRDSSMSRQLAQTMSQKESEIIVCEEPEAVEALLSQGAIDILVIDLPLGIPLIHHLATNYPETVLVGLAGDCDHETVEIAEQAGVQVILDPLDLELDTPKRASQLGLIQHFGRLEDFLAKNQVAALLQPIVSLQDPGTTLGLESLARPPRHLPLWDPETLFAYAARKEYLLETDLLCLQAAFKEARLIPDLKRLFVNLRPRSVTHPQFIKRLLELCTQADIKPQQVVFELTEQQSILNLEFFLKNLSQLKKLGFEIALDDFGTGFASFQWLYDFKPHYLKIAGIFCRGLESDTTKQVLLSSITQIAQKLHIITILENIETEAECEVAKSLGIDYGQGYYFCKPATAFELLEKI